jgi:hypothetical protein
VAGVAWRTPAPEARSRAARSTPSVASSRLASSTQPPVRRGRKISSPAMSKASEVTASSRSPGATPGERRIDPRKLTNARKGIPTPLGRPVEPEV